MSTLTLYAESTFMSPWVFHAMIALEEKQLPYSLEIVPLPIPPATRAELQAKAVLGKVPVLAHGNTWISESLAISEYLAEAFPWPDHPRLFPESLTERARARQIMSSLRTSLMALREDRPTSSVFTSPVTKPLSEKARTDAAELVRIAEAVVKPGKHHMFDGWCIADADLTLALMRLIANGDAVPDHVRTYARANWDRPSVRTFVSRVPTS
jgi:glutathione S-transferase